MKPIASPERSALHVYHWEARDARGQLLKGETAATNRAALKAQLRQQGLIARRLQRKREPLAWRGVRIAPRDVALFTRQLATMLKAGLPLVQALELSAATLDNGAIRTRILSLRDTVAQGDAFSVALRDYPCDFEPLYGNLVAAGESSGTLDVLLERLANHLEQAQALKARIAKALRYPCIVMAVALSVTTLLLVKVVPAFAATFADLGAELPTLTQRVLSLSNWTRDWWPWLAGSVFSLVVLMRHAVQRSPRAKRAVDALSLHIPVLGSVVRYSALARFSRTLATTFAAGLPLTDALAASAGATGNDIYQTAVLNARAALETGEALSRSLRQSPLFPPLLVQLVGVGEESGTLDTLLTRCADIYEADATTLTDNLTALLEPLIMAALGIIVGVLLLALYLPLFQLGSVI